MARDYLSIPGTSTSVLLLHLCDQCRIAATTVDVERLLSRGRLMLQHTRNCCRAARVRSLICLGNWLHHNLVSDEVIRGCARQAPVGTVQVVTTTAVAGVD